MTKVTLTAAPQGPQKDVRQTVEDARQATPARPDFPEVLPLTLETSTAFDEMETLFATIGITFLPEETTAEGPFLTNKDALMQAFSNLAGDKKIPLTELVEKCRIIVENCALVYEAYKPEIPKFSRRISTMLGLFCNGKKAEGEKEFEEIMKVFGTMRAPERKEQPPLSEAEKAEAKRTFEELKESFFKHQHLDISIENLVIAYQNGPRPSLDYIKQAFAHLPQGTGIVPEFTKTKLAVVLGLLVNGYTEEAKPILVQLKKEIKVSNEVWDLSTDPSLARGVKGEIETEARYMEAIIQHFQDTSNKSGSVFSGVWLCESMDAYVGVVKATRDLVKIKEDFINRDPNASEADKTLRKACFEAGVETEDALHPLPKIKWIETKPSGEFVVHEENLLVAASLAEYEQNVKFVEQRQKVLLAEMYKRTGEDGPDGSYKKSFLNLQADQKESDDEAISAAFEAAHEEDRKQQEARQATSEGDIFGREEADEATIKSLDHQARLVLGQVSDDFQKIRQLQATDPKQAFSQANAFRNDLKTLKAEGKGKYEMDIAALANTPVFEKVFTQMVTLFENRAEGFLKELAFNNPAVVNYLNRLVNFNANTLPFLKSLRSMISNMEEKKEAYGRPAMQQMYDDAWKVRNEFELYMQDEQIAEGRSFLQMIGAKMPGMFADDIDFVGSVKKLNDVTKKDLEYVGALRNATEVTLSIDPSGTGAGDFFKEAGKWTAIMAVAVLAGVGMGMAVTAAVEGSVLASGTLLASVGKTVLLTVSVGTATGAASAWTAAIINGNYDVISDEASMLKVLGFSIGMMGAFQVGGYVLGSAAGRAGAWLGKFKDGTQKAWARKFLERAERELWSGARTHSGFAGFRKFLDSKFLRKFGEEFWEETQEEALQQLGLAISPEHPFLGFLISLMPSSRQRARHTFLGKMGVYSPVPGVVARFTNSGVLLQYNKTETSVAEVSAYIQSRGATPDVVAQFESTGKLDYRADNATLKITPTDLPAEVAGILMSDKGKKAAKKAGLKRDPASGRIEMSDPTKQADLVELFESAGFIVVHNPDGTLTASLEGVSEIVIHPALAVEAQSPRVELALLAKRVSGFLFHKPEGTTTPEGGFDGVMTRKSAVKKGIAQMVAAGFLVTETEDGLRVEKGDFSARISVDPSLRPEIRPSLEAAGVLVDADQQTGDTEAALEEVEEEVGEEVAEESEGLEEELAPEEELPEHIREGIETGSMEVDSMAELLSTLDILANEGYEEHERSPRGIIVINSEGTEILINSPSMSEDFWAQVQEAEADLSLVETDREATFENLRLIALNNPQVFDYLVTRIRMIDLSIEEVKTLLNARNTHSDLSPSTSLRLLMACRGIAELATDENIEALAVRLADAVPQEEGVPHEFFLGQVRTLLALAPAGIVGLAVFLQTSDLAAQTTVGTPAEPEGWLARSLRGAFVDVVEDSWDFFLWRVLLMGVLPTTYVFVRNRYGEPGNRRRGDLPEDISRWVDGLSRFAASLFGRPNRRRARQQALTDATTFANIDLEDLVRRGLLLNQYIPEAARTTTDATLRADIDAFRAFLASLDRGIWQIPGQTEGVPETATPRQVSRLGIGEVQLLNTFIGDLSNFFLAPVPATPTPGNNGGYLIRLEALANEFQNPQNPPRPAEAIRGDMIVLINEMWGRFLPLIRSRFTRGRTGFDSPRAGTSVLRVISLVVFVSNILYYLVRIDQGCRGCSKSINTAVDTAADKVDKIEKGVEALPGKVKEGVLEGAKKALDWIKPGESPEDKAKTDAALEKARRESTIPLPERTPVDKRTPEGHSPTYDDEPTDDEPTDDEPTDDDAADDEPTDDDAADDEKAKPKKPRKKSRFDR